MTIRVVGEAVEPRARTYIYAHKNQGLHKRDKLPGASVVRLHLPAERQPRKLAPSTPTAPTMASSAASASVMSTASASTTSAAGSKSEKSSSSSYALRVFLRVRPALPKEPADDNVLQISPPAADGVQTVRVVTPEGGSADQPLGRRGHPVQDRHTFTFDGVFGPKSLQADVFARAVEPCVAACLQGFNATAFCYGPSGTGKSFTCYGAETPKGDRNSAIKAWATHPLAGMIPRSAEQLFASIERGGALSRTRFLLRVSFLQIYREGLSDLLAGKGAADHASGGGLALREDPHRGVFVEGLTEVAVRTPQEVWALAAKGQRARHTAATRLNDVSSRSHAVFTVIIEQSFEPSADADGSAATATGGSGSGGNGTGGGGGDSGGPAAMKLSRLNLVDLAGSERAALLGESGERLEESKKINLSLSALAKVIHTLVDARGRSVHVPYRDSKLTRILQDSLGGNCRTTMIACVSPIGQVAEDTLSTLHFASRAKTIQNHAVVNVQAGDHAASSSLLAQYEAQLSQLREQLREAEKEKEGLVPPSALAAQQQQPAVDSETLKIESEKAIAAEAALAQCVREYAKERAQKVRLQQQISALQKRLLKTQIDELQDKVLIGGQKKKDETPAAEHDSPEAPGTAASTPAATPVTSPTRSVRGSEAHDAADPSSLSPSSLSVALAAERRRADKLEARVRALQSKVLELSKEVEAGKMALAKAKKAGYDPEAPEAGPLSAARRAALGDLPTNSPKKAQAGGGGGGRRRRRRRRWLGAGGGACRLGGSAAGGCQARALAAAQDRGGGQSARGRRALRAGDGEGEGRGQGGAAHGAAGGGPHVSTRNGGLF